MDNNTFFSEKNTDLLYTICRDEVLKKTNYNIDSNKKYFKTFGQIMKIVHKHSPNKDDLSNLNNKTIGKTIPYLVEEIEKKQLKEKPLIPTNNILNAPPIKTESIASRNNNTPNGLPVSFRATSTINHSSLQTDYNKILEERKDYHEIPENISMTVEDNTKYEDTNVLLDRQMKERENISEQHKPNLEQKMNQPQTENIPRVQRTLLETQTAPSNPELNLQSFDLNEEVLGDLYGNTDMNTFNGNDNVDPMKLFQQHMNQREEEDSDYKKMQQDTITFEEQQKKDNLIIDAMKDNREVRQKQEEMEFQKSLSQELNSKMNDMNIESIKSQMDRRIEQSLDDVMLPPTANDLQIAQDNKLDIETKQYFEMKKDIFEKRNYINREHLLVVNSGDRDWMNETEDRYSFQVRFKPSTGENGESGLGVDNLYRNIVSFEMVRVLMAIENIIIPFDNRFFIDYKSLPYIALKIDEIQPLYDGTNGRINNTFAKLLFDKDHTNEVLVNANDGSGSSFSSKYSRQLKRGYSSMAPMSNEKKTFYPSPLASLNRLTISMITPYGANIKNHPDVLTIDEINYKAHAGDLELQDSTGFRGHNTGHYIEVTTTTAFSNRVFKIGDNVRFRGFDSDSSDSNISTFIDFINRETGHYIVNLELEAKGPTENEGYITKFYISPPGDIDYSGTGTQTGYFQIGTANLKNSQTCKVINQSIQTHFVFKVVTREDDMTPVMKAVNV